MSTKLSLLTSRDAVSAAMAECDQLGRDNFLKHYGYKFSRLYPLRHSGKTYDSKAIVGVAYGKQHGTALKARDFSGGAATVVPTLHRLGFSVSETPHPIASLVKGATYFRKDLLERYGGQLQRGIWTPRDFLSFSFSPAIVERHTDIVMGGLIAVFFGTRVRASPTI